MNDMSRSAAPTFRKRGGGEAGKGERSPKGKERGPTGLTHSVEDYESELRLRGIPRLGEKNGARPVCLVFVALWVCTTGMNAQSSDFVLRLTAFFPSWKPGLGSMFAIAMFK